MIDPLSIAGSIAGLISISKEIAVFLYTISSSAFGAPVSVKALHVEISSLQGIFHQLQRLETRIPLPTREILQETLDGFHSIFLDLEQHLCELSGLSGLSEVSSIVLLWKRLNWTAKQPQIDKLLDELERCKSSLGMILGLINA
jgi:hypothetical protein